MMTTSITQQEIDKQIDAAMAHSAEHIISEPKACEVHYNKQSRKIIIHFDNDCTFECPVSLLQGVCDLTDDEIAQVELTPAGWGITWSDNDLDFGVNELVQGVFGTKAWMKEIAAKGGRSKSEKKQAASRINGKKGGRPSKIKKLMN
jgi:hypothetical protein